MNQKPPKYFRVLAIAPSTRGFGFAVLEGPETLVDWGAKPVKGDKNVQSLSKAETLIAHYQPDVLVLPDVLAKSSRRAPRIKELTQQLMDSGRARKIKVALFSSKQVKRRFLVHDQGTKHQLAEILAQRFEAELGSCLPPKRSLWKSEDRRMDIFDAVALVLAFRRSCIRSRM